MVSPELIRRYPFFAGLSMDYLKALARVAEEHEVEEGHVFFRSNDMLYEWYLILEGEVGIYLDPPARDVEHGIADQLTGQIQTKDVLISDIWPGHIFGWSALFPPYEATAGAKALKPTRVIAFDAVELGHRFEEDHHFGFLMAQKLAQVIHQRLHDRRVESLSHHVV